MNGILGKTCCMLLALLLATPHASAQNDVSETQVKAAYLLKFPSYVEWPDGTFIAPDSPMILGVIGADQLASTLEQLGADVVVNGHPVTIRRLLPGDTVGDLHVLFVGGVASTVVSGFLSQAARRPVLTVSETLPPLPDDSVINFSLSDNKVRFDVALAPAQRMGLRLSSRLLQVARLVIPTP